MVTAPDEVDVTELEEGDEHYAECPEDEIEKHVYLGIIPGAFADPMMESGYVKASVCTGCGGVRVYHPDESEVEQVEEDLVGVFQEYGILTEEEAKDVLQ